jgi:hypothetical protein
MCETLHAKHSSVIAQDDDKQALSACFESLDDYYKLDEKRETMLMLRFTLDRSAQPNGWIGLEVGRKTIELREYFN